MNYSYQKPNPLLTDFVQTILVIADGLDFDVSNLPLFTNGVPALLCQIKSGDQLQLTLFGQGIPLEKLKNKQLTTIAIFFKPFSLSPIFNISAKELKEKPVGLSCWSAQKMLALQLQLIHAKSITEKVKILDHFVLGEFQLRQRECEIIRRATNQLMHNQHTEILAQLLGELNLTERTFQRTFKKFVGITANQYRRICQFQFAFSQLKGKHFDKLTDVAYDNGYFDQSHYIRSFKEFTETTPNDYLQHGLAPKQK
jgi:AraC-like DNA-binding protein